MSDREWNDRVWNNAVFSDHPLWTLSAISLADLEERCCNSIIKNNDCLEGRLAKYNQIKRERSNVSNEWRPLLQFRYTQHLNNMRYYIDVSRRWISTNQRLLSDIRMVVRTCHVDPDTWRDHLLDDLRNIVLSYVISSPLTLTQIHAEDLNKCSSIYKL